MSTFRFPVSSDLLELLVLFEKSKDLKDLAQKIGRDPSVVSRNLQRLADEYPVIAKVHRRWALTSTGKLVNQETQRYVAKIVEILREQTKTLEKPPAFGSSSLLLVLNAQRALEERSKKEPKIGRRNNSVAETNIIRLLRVWRQNGWPILHVPHVMDEPGSPLHRDSEGFKFIPGLDPLPDEEIMEKTKTSAFAKTNLEAKLEERGIRTLVLTGFTANECIDATSRQASDLGFLTYVVEDATATFDFTGPDGRLVPAERVHRLILANLSAFYAKIIDTHSLTNLISG